MRFTGECLMFTEIPQAKEAQEVGGDCQTRVLAPRKQSLVRRSLVSAATCLSVAALVAFLVVPPSSTSAQGGSSCGGRNAGNYVPQSWTELNTYDPCLSSTTNWNRTFADKTISTTIDGSVSLQVTSSVSLAGAIASIKVNGKEFIASGGHGSALQYALHAHGTSECYNPTEAGSKTDDARPGYTNAPYHGPSTSSLYYLTGTSNQISTSNRMAFYIPTGSRSEWDGCTPNYPAGSPYNLGLSPYLVTKTVKVGVRTETGTLQNVITFDATVNVESPETSSNYDAVLIAYLQDDFNTYFKFNPATGVAQYITLQQISANPNVGTSSDPVIISTGNGSYAIGIYSPRLLNTQFNESRIYYLGYSPGTGTYPHRNYTLQTTNYASNIQPGALYYKNYFAVGNLERVKSTLRELYRLNS